MPLFFKTEKKVHDMIFEYLDIVDHCMDSFAQAIYPCLESGKEKVLPEHEKTHELESRADDLQRDIALMLFGRALLPDARYDILNMLESIDMVPNAAETVLAAMLTERIYIPEEFKPAFRELVDINLEAAHKLRRTAEVLLTDPKNTMKIADEVDELESNSDRLERRIVTKMFSKDYPGLEKADKLLLKNTVFQIGAISDRAENAADRMTITAIKRRI